MSDATCNQPACDGTVSARGMCARHYNRWYTTGSPEISEPTICKKCGVKLPLKKARTGPRSPYCSDSCRRGSWTPRPPRQYMPVARAQKPCLACSGSFEARRADVQFCSARCSTIHRDLNSPTRCSEADCDRGVRAKGLCSMHWRRVARAEGREANPVWNARRKANWKKRHALTRGAAGGESFDYLDVYVRDNWTCGICRVAVDPDLAWPDPMSVSLDHVVPVARGGLHAPENAQCAHLVCNLRKGDRVSV